MMGIVVDDAHADGVAYAVAPLWRRALAYALDGVVAIALTLLMHLMVGAIRGSTSPVFSGTTVVAPEELRAYGFAEFLGFALFFAYLHVVPEIWNGQTLGKRALGIRIALLDGTVPRSGTFAARAGLYGIFGFAMLSATGLFATGTAPGDVYVVASVTSLLVVVTEVVVVLAAVGPSRRSLVDRFADTVVVFGHARTGAPPTGTVSRASGSELAWSFPMLVVILGLGAASASGPPFRAPAAPTAKAPATAQRSAADDAAIASLGLLERQVVRCLERGDGPNACADPRDYRGMGLRLAELPDGASMAFNPAGRYAGQVALNPEGGVVGLYAYTSRRVWWLETGDPDRRGCALPSARDARGDWKTCGDGYRWPAED